MQFAWLHIAYAAQNLQRSLQPGLRRPGVMPSTCTAYAHRGTSPLNLLNWQTDIDLGMSSHKGYGQVRQLRYVE